MEKQRSDIISDIRACLISTKGKLELRQLDRDYLTLVGERIPYSTLGFKRLEDFLKSEPTLLVSKGSNGEVYVDAKISDKSAHITEMVYKQKNAKKKVLRKSVKFSTRITPVQTANWRPKEVGPKGRHLSTPPRLAKVSHNQFINRVGYNKPSVPSKVVVPETSGLHQIRLNPKLQRQNSETRNSNISNRLHINFPPPQENGKTEEPSPLSSTKKRITQKMSELSLEKTTESENGSSGSDPSPTIKDLPPVQDIQPKAPEFVMTGDPIVDLKNFVELHNMGKVEVSSKLVKTKQNRLFTCRIKVSKHTYTSYPKEFDSPIKAEQFCAQEALNDLMTKYDTKKSLLLASVKDILDRIPPMLEKHNHGIWAWQLQLDYADKYKEQLPSDWLKIIDSSPCIQVEKCLDSYVLRHCKPGDVLQKGHKWNTFMMLSDVSVPSNTIQFGEDGKLYAEVTCVMSANEIWCRQYSTEESEVYNDMIVKMEAYYSENHQTCKAGSITAAGYYVALYDNVWYRVRAVSFSETEVQCFLIDYGDELSIPKVDVYQLKREFASTQAQAFVCRLAGLENLYDASANSEGIQSLLSRQVILEMAVDNVVDENIQDVSIPVFMYDSETGKSLNQEIIPLLTMESASPVIQKKTTMEVYITNIEENGDVYVQLHSPGFESLQTLLGNLESEIGANPPTDLISPVTKNNSRDKLYLAKYKTDGHWYRTQLIDWSPKGDLAQIYFVDWGNTDVINVKEEVLYPLEKLSDVLSQYPFQAVKVGMALEKVPEDFVDLASKAMPKDQPVLLKVSDYDSHNVPLVEFFKRNSDGGLFCINKSIAMESEIKKEKDAANMRNAKRKVTHLSNNKKVPSGGTLPKPSIPSKGQYFDVHVPFAVNPYNFFVQPLSSHKKLFRMMDTLQKRYREVQYSPLQVEQIVPGQIYASKHEDGSWYRTSVIKVIHSGSISVFYCDFGYYGNLTVQQLIPLDVEFMQLPYQALNAKLSGIKPKQSKWTMADCEKFKAMIEKRNFYSVIVDIERDELYESDTVLKLILIDTSTELDVYFGQELIKVGIAITA